jgi:hypothetical protein
MNQDMLISIPIEFSVPYPTEKAAWQQKLSYKSAIKMALIGIPVARVSNNNKYYKRIK